MVQREIISIVTDFVSALRSSGMLFDKIILFGSYIKGTADEWSDIDLAVVSTEFGKDKFEEKIALARIAYKIDPRLEIHPVNSYEYENEDWRTIIHEIKTTGIEIAA